MPHIKNKLDWCLKKAQDELLKGDKHRGLVKKDEDILLARKHLIKAEHNLKAIIDFKKIGYSDWSASAAFYSVYHCFLSILSKFGYESRNQECTFAVIYDLIDSGKIDLSKELIERIQSLDIGERQERVKIIDIRESEQYGVNLSLDNKTFEEILEIAQIILDKTKEVVLGD